MCGRIRCYILRFCIVAHAISRCTPLSALCEALIHPRGGLSTLCEALFPDEPSIEQSETAIFGRSYLRPHRFNASPNADTPILSSNPDARPSQPSQFRVQWMLVARVAQWIEHRSPKAGVDGSNPFSGTKFQTLTAHNYVRVSYIRQRRIGVAPLLVIFYSIVWLVSTSARSGLNLYPEGYDFNEEE
jgi:hypothetical protein